MWTKDEIETRAGAVPPEERPVPAGRLAGIGSFLGIYGGEHIAATEFVIGALLVTWGVKAGELLFGLVVGNLLAASSYALVTAPIAVDTRMTLFAYLRKVMGPWFQRVYNFTWGAISVVWAASMLAISATSLKEVFGLPVQLHAYPTSGACVALTLALAAVTVFVAAYGFRGVVRFSSLCVPWMVSVFLCGALVALPLLCAQTGFPAVRGPSDFLALLEAHVFNGSVPEGRPHLTWIHVAMFAWMCGYVYHLGLNDMSIFRFAKKRSYGWVGLFGMYLGHFFAWVCAGVMGAAAAAVLNVGLDKLDSGAVTKTVLGGAGLIAVVVAGWTTATPNIYRAALSFATFLPKWSLRRLSFLVGAVIALAACFPAVMRIDMVANIAGLIVPPVGAICLVEHWIFPRLGWTRHWNLYRGRAVNAAGLAAWITAALFALAGVLGGWMHPFFLPLPTFLVGGFAYLLFARLAGANRPVPADVRADVDAVEARIAALAEEDAAKEDAATPVSAAPARLRSRLATALRVLSWAALALMVVHAVAVLLGVAPLGADTSAPLDVFKSAAFALTLAYFASAALADALRRRTTSRTPTGRR